MIFVCIVVSILLSMFSTIVMSYVALATPIGPWIAPTLVCIVVLCSRLVADLTSASMAYLISAGSIGGIMATACAFSFPTIYFLDPSTFNQWMQSPLFFSLLLGSFSFLAAIFGFFIADISEKKLLIDQELSFPVGQLVHKMIFVQHNIRKSYELVIGFCGALIVSLLQNIPFLHYQLIPKTITLLSSTCFSFFSCGPLVINLDTAPMVWAIGFVTGHVIAIPLAIGALASIFIAHPLQRLFFSHLSSMEFTLAFCSGIVLFITFISLLGLPRRIISGIRKTLQIIEGGNNVRTLFLEPLTIVFCISIMSAMILFFSYFAFPWYVQLYLGITSIITTYQIAAIAGRIGLALLGRFATFVMVPAMLIFNLTYVQLVFIATFIEISGGVAADVLFGRKLALLSGLSVPSMRRYQLLGLFIASLTIGIVFWLLIHHFGLGSPALFAYRAQSRQLLIQAQQFNYIVLGLGALFGMILHVMQLNPMLALGGLLMPLDMTFGLIVGGMMAACSVHKEEWYPVWSGVFAGSSISMLLKTIL
jgi:hypothetical protein